MASVNSTVGVIAAADVPPPYRLPRRIPAGAEYSAVLLHVTTEFAYLERDRQLAETVALEVHMGAGADDNPSIPLPQPEPPKADDVVLHLATRRMQAGYQFGSAA